MYYSLNKSAFDKKKNPKNKTIVGSTFYCFTDQREKTHTFSSVLVRNMQIIFIYLQNVMKLD